MVNKFHATVISELSKCYNRHHLEQLSHEEIKTGLQFHQFLVEERTKRSRVGLLLVEISKGSIFQNTKPPHQSHTESIFAPLVLRLKRRVM